MWSTPTVPALGKMRPEGHEFEDGLDYMTSLRLA